MGDDGLKERFVIIRKELGLNIKNFADSLDMAPTTVSSIESGSREPSKEVLIKLASRYSVNLHWMLTGDGNKYASEVGFPKGLKDLVTIRRSNSDGRKLDSLPDVMAEQEIHLQEKQGQDFNLFKFQHGKTIMIDADETDPSALVILPVYGQRASAGPGQEQTQLEAIEANIPVVFEMLGGAAPQSCGVVRVVGDSMTDMGLFDGDLAIFDQSRLEGDGVFVISIGNAVRIKRLEYRPFDQKIIISSENSKRYPNPEIITFEQAEALLCVHGKVICWMHRHPY
jgi:SOS-response transcriptional repressor LexA